MNHRHAWMLICALLAACGAQQESASTTPPQAAPAPAEQSPAKQTTARPPTEQTPAVQPSAAMPAKPVASSPAPAMNRQSAQDVRAEAPKAGRADIARATRLPAMPEAGSRTTATTEKSVTTAASAAASAARNHGARAKQTAKAAATSAAKPTPTSLPTPKPTTAPAMTQAVSFDTHKCKACHSVKRKKVGPAWKDVAVAYGSAEALARVFKAGFKVADRKLIAAQPKWKHNAGMMTAQFNRLIKGHEDAAAQALFAAVQRGKI